MKARRIFVKLVENKCDLIKILKNEQGARAFEMKLNELRKIHDPNFLEQSSVG